MGTELAVYAAYAAVVYAGVSAATADSPEPPKAPEAPSLEDAEAGGKKAMEDRRRAGAVGRQQTKSAGLLTEEADTEKKTLLGG